MTARVVEQALITELIGGQAYSSRRCSKHQSKAASRLGMIIGSAFDLGDTGPGGWWIVDRPELHLAEDIIVPDLGGWRTGRSPEYPETDGCEVAPDWVCEVLVPGAQGMSRAKKLPAYGRHRVQYIWLVDPFSQVIEVKHLENGLWFEDAVFGGDDMVRAQPFAHIEFNASVLWISPLCT